MRIEIRIPANRNLRGVLRLIDERGVTVFTCPALAKADNARARREGNPSRDPLKRFGDTPLGTWEGRIGPRFSKPEDVRTYGVHRVITLRATGGDALVAAKKGKRSGIWLHGGAPGIGGILRPTFGCVRVADDHMGAILEIILRWFVGRAPAQQWVPVATVAV